MEAIPRFNIDDDEAIKRCFERKGFAIVANALEANDLNDVKDDVAAVIQAYLVKAGLPEVRGEEVFTEGLLSLEDKDHEYVASVYDTIFQTPSFMRLISNRRIERQVKLLLGIDAKKPLYGFTNRCLLAPPNDERRTYGWHQEVFHTIPYGHYVQTWAPLVFDTTISNGTIEVCCGFHKEGIAPQEWTEPEGRNFQVIVNQAVVDKYPQIPVEMKVGELLLFSGFLAHRSGKNRSGKVRYSLVGMYHDISHAPFMTPKEPLNN